MANQQSAAAKGNPLFPTPVIISIRCITPSSLAMISTFKWQRGEGKTNVGSRRQGQRGRNVVSRRSKQEAVGPCRLSLTVWRQHCSKKKKKITFLITSRVKQESQTEIQTENPSRSLLWLKCICVPFILTLAKNKFPSPGRGLRHLKSDSPTETKVTFESRHFNDPTLTRGAFKITFHGG